MSPELVRKPLYYDALQRRLWIRGQRLHHGATGALVASAGVVALLALRAPLLGGVVAAGGALMLHDWKDREVWFQRGWQTP
jgi:hypothetical protein